MWVLYFHIHFHAGYILTQWITDAGRLLYKNMYDSLYCKGSKRVTQGLRVRGSWRSNGTAIFWPSLLWPSRCVFLVLLMPNRRLRAHSAGWWLSLLHFISIFSGPQLSLMWFSLPHLVYNSVRFSTQLVLAWLLSWLSYIIVQRPLDRPLDLWNRMFDRHQAEITVMQFTGHSLPVHQSKSVPWEFFARPIS